MADIALTDEQMTDVLDLLGYPLLGQRHIVSGLNMFPTAIPTAQALENNMRSLRNEFAVKKVIDKIKQIQTHRQTIDSSAERMDIKSIYKAVEFESMPKAIQQMWVLDYQYCEQLAKYFSVPVNAHPTLSGGSGGGNIPIIERC